MRAYRRQLLVMLAGWLIAPRQSEADVPRNDRDFIAEAFRMKDRAVASGDQPYGAVVVVGGKIAGYGPSRVVAERNPDAHAERVALWDAQQKLGTKSLAGAVIYSSSRPCGTCQASLAQAGIVRMVYGASATDGGKPKP